MIPDVNLKSNGAYWQAWWRDEKGRRLTRSIGAKAKLTRRQAQAKCRALAVRLMLDPQDVLGELAPRTAPRLSEWLERYARQHPHHSRATRYINEAAGNYLKRYFDHDPPIDRITRADAAEWRAALASGELSLDNANRCDAPGEATVCKHVRAAKTIFAEAEDQGLLAANPFGRLRGTPPRPGRNWRQIDQADMKRILDACPNAGWRCLMGLCRFAGLRRGEALRLGWADVQWAGNRMIVNADQKVTTKSRPRTVPIELAKCPTGLTAILREAFEAAPDGAVLVCEGVNRTTVDLKVRQLLTASGVGIYAKPFHTLRKCCESSWAMRYPQHAVSEWLGHDITVSADHYLRVPEELYATAERAQFVPK